MQKERYNKSASGCRDTERENNMNETYITTELLAQYAHKLYEEEKSSATIEKYIRDVRTFSKYAGSQALTKDLTIAYKRDAVKAEMARRSALRSPSKTAVTGRSCYTSKFALSDRLVCGECGTLYRRCTWTSLGRKYPVWRCTSRLNYGTKYCHDSPTIKEEPLQNAILAAINSAMSNKPALLDLIKNAVSLELLPVQGQTMSLADIERRLTQLDEQFQRLLAEAIDAEDKEACNAQFAEILAEQTAFKKQKEEILQSSVDTDRICTRMKQAEQAVENATSTITGWNENAVRQTVERVTVLSANEILVRIKGGAEIKQRLERK